MAVPSDVEYCTVTVSSDALSRVTVNMKWLCSPSPSATARSAMDTAGGVDGAVSTSSLTMVATPTPSPMTALTGAERFRVNCSSSSTMVSPVTATLTVLTVSPAANVRVPTVGV